MRTTGRAYHFHSENADLHERRKAKDRLRMPACLHREIGGTMGKGRMVAVVVGCSSGSPSGFNGMVGSLRGGLRGSVATARVAMRGSVMDLLGRPGPDDSWATDPLTA